MSSKFVNEIKRTLADAEESITKRLCELIAEHGPLMLGTHKIEVIYAEGITKTALKVTQVYIDDEGEIIMRGVYTDMETGEELTESKGQFVPLQTDVESMLYILDACEKTLQEKGQKI